MPINTGIQVENTMAHGGKRTGSGRPKMDPVKRSLRLMEELLLPAFRWALTDEFSEVVVAIRDIEAAFGRPSVAEWKTWFEVVELGSGIGAGEGGVGTRWRLKMRMTVAAKKLLLPHQHDGMPWPPEAIKEAQNKNAYIAFKKVFDKTMAELAKTYNHKVVQCPSYDPSKNWKVKASKVQDRGARGPLSDADKGFVELLFGPDHGFSLPYVGFTPEASDVPY